MYSSVDTTRKMIEDGNVEDAKIRILNSIQMSASKEYFRDLMVSLESASVDIFDQDNGFELNPDKSQWTSDYLAQIKEELKFNFSRGKLRHYNDIALYIAPEVDRDKGQARPKKENVNWKVSSKNQTNAKAIKIIKVTCAILACAVLMKCIVNAVDYFKKPTEIRDKEVKIDNKRG